MSNSSDLPARPRAALVVRSGSLEGRRFPLEGDETLIGRSPATEVTLIDDGVSREHAVLTFDEATGTWALEDLQTTNGTRVNGKRIRSSALQSGDEVQIGNTRLSFLVG